MRQTEEEKRRADLIKIIELKQASLDARVGTLAMRKQVNARARDRVEGTMKSSGSVDDILWLDRTRETAGRELSRLEKSDASLEQDIRKLVEDSVALDIAKRTLS